MEEFRSLGLEEGKIIGEATLTVAREKLPSDCPIAVAVVNRAGHLIYFAREDGCSAIDITMAINKAYSVTQWYLDTSEVHSTHTRKVKPSDIVWYGDSRQAPVPGGVRVRATGGAAPREINVNGAMAGGVGVSSRRSLTPNEDEEIARLGAAAFKGHRIESQKGDKSF